MLSTAVQWGATKKQAKGNATFYCVPKKHGRKIEMDGCRVFEKIKAISKTEQMVR